MTKLTIRTDDYERSHGKQPRGKGNWAFYPTSDSHNAIWAPPRITLSEAKRWLRDQDTNCRDWQVAP